MKKQTHIKFLALFLILAYVLSACSGAPVGTGGQPSGDDQAQEVVFTGTVESMGGGEWTVSGQTISLTGTTSVDANIQVGDNVKVEAVVDANGMVSALSIEIAGADDDNANSNDSNDNANSNDDNANDINANDDNTNGGGDDISNSDNGNANGNDNGNDNGDDLEVFGTVEAITADTLTIGGVTYLIADSTEFNDLIAVGDSVKLHVILNADGTLTIREIEKSDESVDNANSNDSDDNSNSNDDDSNDDDGNSNGNDDNGNDDHGNDNGSGDGENDNNSGSNSNG